MSSEVMLQCKSRVSNDFASLLITTGVPCPLLPQYCTYNAIMHNGVHSWVVTCGPVLTDHYREVAALQR